MIKSFKKYLPACVQNVILRGDGEFLSWDAVKAAEDDKYVYIFGNKGCKPSFDPTKWYSVRGHGLAEYNEGWYKPTGWPDEGRFVAMRIPKEKQQGKTDTQLELLEDGGKVYRVFATNHPGKPHQVIDEYDKRADCENLIGESKREGLSAIPTHRFMSNYAFFQIVLLAYNLWRSFKMLAEHGEAEVKKRDDAQKERASPPLRGIQDNTIRIARLKLLLIAAKLTEHGNGVKVRYSEHDSRVAGLFGFMSHLDRIRERVRPWVDGILWQCRHMKFLRPQTAAHSP